MCFGEPQPFAERGSPTILSVGITKLRRVIVPTTFRRQNMKFIPPRIWCPVSILQHSVIPRAPVNEPTRQYKLQMS